jgi:GR25 family glycosyltransferase involved in LPS biosynthesis
MYKIYIINMNRHPERLAKQLKALRAVGITDVVRVTGVVGDAVTNDPRISSLCQYTCPYSVIGCGMSHYNAYETFLADEDGNDACLILEDDAFPLFKDRSDLDAVLTAHPPSNWDIFKLHCDGLFKGSCPSNDDLSMAVDSGSNAAYFVSRAGAQKLLRTRLYTHIDFHMNINTDLIKRKTPYNYFYTDEAHSDNRNDGGGGGWFNFLTPHGEKTYDNVLSMKMFRIPGTDIELTAYNIIFFIIFVCCLTAYLHRGLWCRHR